MTHTPDNAVAGDAPLAGPSQSQRTPTQVPIRLSLLQNLTTQSLLLTQLFSILSSNQPVNSTQIGVPQLRSALQISTSDLSQLVKEAYEHQRAWKELEVKRREVEQLELRVRNLVRGLEKGREELEGIVKEGKEVLERVDKVDQKPISASTLLAHAHALARHSSAPVSSLLSTIDKSQYMPWPTEMNMRQGLLFQMQGSMSGVGDRGVIGEEKAPAQVVEEKQPEQHVHEEPGRRYDPNAVFQLELNSDDSDDD